MWPSKEKMAGNSTWWAKMAAGRTLADWTSTVSIWPHDLRGQGVTASGWWLIYHPLISEYEWYTTSYQWIGNEEQSSDNEQQDPLNPDTCLSLQISCKVKLEGELNQQKVKAKLREVTVVLHVVRCVWRKLCLLSANARHKYDYWLFVFDNIMNIIIIFVQWRN